jgi:hypothetical protein
MAQIRHQQEMLTDAGRELCLQMAGRALDEVRARPQQGDGCVTGAVGSYGMYNMHDCRNNADLPVSLTVTVDDLDGQCRLIMVAESRWPFENLVERTAGQYHARCEELVDRVRGSIAGALTPVGVS